MHKALTVYSCKTHQVTSRWDKCQWCSCCLVQCMPTVCPFIAHLFLQLSGRKTKKIWCPSKKKIKNISRPSTPTYKKISSGWKKTLLSQQQSLLPGEYCTANTDKCNPCGGKRPKPEKPDGSYDTMGAVTAIAKGGPLDIWWDWRLL